MNRQYSKKNTLQHNNNNTGTVLNEKVSSYVIFETDFSDNMIYFIKCYDFLDAQRRKYGDHVLLPDGESSDEAFFLIHDVMSVVRKLAKGVREKMRDATNSNRIEYARQVLRIILGTKIHTRAFREITDDDDDDDDKEDWRVFSNTFCVARDFVSFHFPSQRFMLCILSEILKWLPSKERLRTTLNKMMPSLDEHNWNEKTVLNIVDIALCPLILSQQILANMWTRNGSSKMYRQVSLYYSHFWTHTGLDMDIFGLQLGIEYLGANRVLSQMLERFDVVNYFVSSPPPLRTLCSRVEFSKHSSITLKYTRTHRYTSTEHQEKMAESFLSLVATLVTDRRHVGHTRERTWCSNVGVREYHHLMLSREYQFSITHIYHKKIFRKPTLEHSRISTLEHRYHTSRDYSKIGTS